MDPKTIVIGFIILLAGIISVELGVSTAILLIIAGFITKNFLAFETPEWVTFFGNLGFLSIVFFAGFEVKYEFVKKHYAESILIGSSAFFIPFVFIFIASYFILALDLIQSIIVGIALSTTSLSLVYCVIHCKKGVFGEYYQIILSSSVFIDFLTILFLSILITKPSIESVVYVVLLIFTLGAVLKLGRFVKSRYNGVKAEIEIRFILLLLLGLAFLVRQITIGETVIIFILGLALSQVYEGGDEKALDEEAIVKEKVRGLIFGFLAPIFFFYAGLLINITQVTPMTLYMILVLTIFAYSGKFISSYIPARKLVNELASKHFGLIFNYRLSFAVVVAILALEQQLILSETYNAIISVTLITTLISSVILKIVPQENYRME